MSTTFIQPLPQPLTVTTTFGQPTTFDPGGHMGVDYAAPAGTPIMSIATGSVSSTTVDGQNDGGLGNSVTILTSDSTKTTVTYAHMQSPPNLAKGTVVQQGNTIGKVGHTGKTNGGDHLHIEVRQNGVLVDPQLLPYNTPPPNASQSVGQGAAQSGTSGSPQDPLVNPSPDQIVHTSDITGVVSRVTEFDSLPIGPDIPHDPHFAYYASAEIKINGKLICPLAPGLGNSDPNNASMYPVDDQTQGFSNDLKLEEFQYQSGTISGNIALFRLFLKSWSDVLEILQLAAQNGDAEIRFGYTNIPGGLIGPIKVRLTDIVPTFLENGYSISVQSISSDNYNSIKAGAIQKHWGIDSGCVSDLVWYIANQQGWRTCIEPTVPDGEKGRPYPQNDMNAFEFMTYLTNYAKSAATRPEIKSENGTGYAPYTVYLQPSMDNDPRPVLHFHPLQPPTDPSSKSQRQYIWGGIKDASSNRYGTVVSFSLVWASAAYTALGGANFEGVAVDPTRKVFLSANISGSDVQEPGLSNNEVAGFTVSASAPNPTYTNHYHDNSMEFLKTQVAAKFFNYRDQAFNASMTILGDPFLRGGVRINVLAVRPIDGCFVYNDWMVAEATHQISGGEYIINLDLKRTLSGNALREGDANLPGLGVGAKFYTQTVEIKSVSKGIVVGQSGSAPNPVTAPNPTVLAKLITAITKQEGTNPAWNNPGGLAYSKMLATKYQATQGTPQPFPGTGYNANFPSIDLGLAALTDEINTQAASGATLASFASNHAQTPYLSALQNALGVKDPNLPLASILAGAQ